MRPSKIVLVALLLAGTLATGARIAGATIQEESCIEPDIEYPVPCDGEE